MQDHKNTIFYLFITTIILSLSETRAETLLEMSYDVVLF